MSTIVPVYDHQQAIQRFVENGLWQGRRHFDNCYCLGFANATEGLVAGMVYHNYDPDTGVVELSAFSSRRDWTNRERVHRVFDLPFSTWGVRLLVARMSEHNHRARGVFSRLGAREYVLADLRAPGEAEALAVLCRGQWQQSKFNGATDDG